MAMKSLTKQTGISLVDLLIATAISLFLIASIFTIYLSNKKTYQYNETLSRLQENTRIAFERLSQDIHRGRNIQFFADKTELHMEEPDPDYVDILAIDGEKITVPGKTDFKVGDDLQIINGERVEVAKIKEISLSNNSQIITLNTALGQKNITGFAEATHLQNIVYYIAKDKDGVSVLYRKDVDNSHMPSGIIDGVSKMKVEFVNQSIKITLLLMGSNKQQLQREWSMIITPRNYLS